jgi:hypothetical protein
VPSRYARTVTVTASKLQTAGSAVLSTSYTAMVSRTLDPVFIIRSLGSLARPRFRPVGLASEATLQECSPSRQSAGGRNLGASWLPIVDHQVELIDEGIDFFEILTPTLFWFDVESATECDHVAEVTNGVL